MFGILTNSTIFTSPANAQRQEVQVSIWPYAQMIAAKFESPSHGSMMEASHFDGIYGLLQLCNHAGSQVHFSYQYNPRESSLNRTIGTVQNSRISISPFGFSACSGAHSDWSKYTISRPRWCSCLSARRESGEVRSKFNFESGVEFEVILKLRVDSEERFVAIPTSFMTRQSLDNQRFVILCAQVPVFRCAQLIFR